MTFRVAMIGCRGVPATFGGVERHVEEIGARLAARGHDVTVFCRTNYVGDRPTAYRGMRLQYLSTVRTKHLEAIVHSGWSTAVALGQHFDIVHYHSLGPGVCAPVPRYFSRARVVQTIHGMDNERRKWGLAGRIWLGAAASLSARVPDATIVVSRELAAHYRKRWDRHSFYVPNGVSSRPHRPPQLIAERFGLSAGRYLLYVGRLVPEKAPDLLLRAFRDVPGDVRLVLAGGSSFTDGYVKDLERLAGMDGRVTCAGYVYGDALDELYTNAAAFVLPSYLEGLPLTLLEAIGAGLPVIASDIPPHVEVLGQGGPGARLFRRGDTAALRNMLEAVLRDLPGEQAQARSRRSQIISEYDWDHAGTETERVYETVTGRRVVIEPTRDEQMENGSPDPPSPPRRFSARSPSAGGASRCRRTVLPQGTPSS